MLSDLTENCILYIFQKIGCRVIGFAGSDDKCDILIKKYGFDKAYNYKKVKVENAYLHVLIIGF